jgi:hypothetical protein
MEGFLTEPVFSVGGRTYSWGDVVAAARHWSSWSAVERRAREGIVCRRHAEQVGDPLTAADIDAAATAFRYERRLLSGDELESWLARWELTTPYWMEYVRRSLLRARWAHELAQLAGRHHVAAAEVGAFVHTEAVCSGALEHLGMRLAERVAVATAVAGAADALDFTAMDGCWERFCADAASPQAIEREVHAQHIDWLRLDCRWLAHDEEDVVREAALCVREDGRDLAAVAGDAGVRLAREMVFLGSAEPALRGHLLGARPGDVLGPLPLGDEFRLIEVIAKRAPTADDPEIRDRAAQAVVQRAVQGEIVNRVRWAA